MEPKLDIEQLKEYWKGNPTAYTVEKNIDDLTLIELLKIQEKECYRQIEWADIFHIAPHLTEKKIHKILKRIAGLMFKKNQFHPKYDNLSESNKKKVDSLSSKINELERDIKNAYLKIYTNDKDFQLNPYIKNKHSVIIDERLNGTYVIRGGDLIVAMGDSTFNSATTLDYKVVVNLGVGILYVHKIVESNFTIGSL